MKKPQPKSRWVFWIGYFLLNLLLFAPGYFLNLDHTSFFPRTELEGFTASWAMVFLRDNLDLFRLCADFLMMAAIVAFIRLNKPFSTILAALCIPVYLFWLIYQIYYAVSVRLYGIHPDLQNDWILIQEYLPAFLDQVTQGNTRQYFWFGGGVILVSVLVGVGVYKWAKISLRTWGNHVQFLGLAILGIVVSQATQFFNQVEVPYRPDYQGVQWISGHFQKSVQIEESDTLKDFGDIFPYNQYTSFELEQKPNIYLLFIESYGKVMATHPDIQDTYADTLQSLELALQDSGWHVASGYSLSPIMGGKSWLAFTSMMAGTRIHNQVQYLKLLEKYPEYPHVIRYFQQQGYQTFRMKTLANQANHKFEELPLVEQFFGFDRWLQFGDFPYKGYEYDYFGGVPDQFALNYFQEEIVQPEGGPFLLFFITMASHTPWFPPPLILDDWRMLDTVQQDPYGFPVPDPDMHPYDQFVERFRNRVKGPLPERIMNSIHYELEMCKDFIVKQGDENSLFILIGDHQPSMIVEYGKDPLETPVHIISQDSSLVNYFTRYGFVPHMEANPNRPITLRHEGLYSLLIRGITTHYGTSARVPDYLIRGL